YMVKSFTRDKDAIQAVLAISEVALVCKTEGRTLLDELEQIYSEFGYYEEDLVSLTLSGKDGSERIKDITSGFREQFPTSMGGFKIERVEDYLRSETTWIASGEIEVIKLPTADVVKCYFEDGSWFCLRPSGTEPKIKFYFSIRGANKEESTNKLEKIKTDLLAYIEA
ncbi:phospho-sugar mutase, partial [Listeria ivanovii]